MARPFHGSFQVLTVTPTNAEVRLVDDPKAAPIFFALDRVRLCYPEQGDTAWTGKAKRRAVSLSKESYSDRTPSTPSDSTGPVTQSMTHANAN